MKNSERERERTRSKERIADGKEKRSLIYSRNCNSHRWVQSCHGCRVCRGFGWITKMSDPHAPIALDRVAIIGYGIPISIGGNPRLFRSAVGGIVFNLFRGRGAHFFPQNAYSRNRFCDNRSKVSSYSLFLVSFHLIVSFVEEVCEFLCEIHLTSIVARVCIPK